MALLGAESDKGHMTRCSWRWGPCDLLSMLLFTAVAKQATTLTPRIGRHHHSNHGNMSPRGAGGITAVSPNTDPLREYVHTTSQMMYKSIRSHFEQCTWPMNRFAVSLVRCVLIDHTCTYDSFTQHMCINTWTYVWHTFRKKKIYKFGCGHFGRGTLG